MRELSSTGHSRFPLFLLLAGLMASGSVLAASTAAGAAPGSAAAGSTGAAAPATGKTAGTATGAVPASAAGASAGAAAPAAGKASTAASAAGEQLFKTAQPPCITCHQLKAGVEQPGPSLAGIAQRAQQRIKARDYKGKARDAKAYIRESIMDPNAYLVPGATYAAGGKSLMPVTYAQMLKPEQVNQLVDYLMTLK